MTIPNIVILNCKPLVVSKNGEEITLRLPGGAEEVQAFEQAVRETHLTEGERWARYAEKHGINLGTPLC